MLIDLTKTLGMTTSEDWGGGILERLLRHIHDHQPNLRADWDRGAGEAWARLLVNGDVVAYISAERTLIFLLDGPLADRIVDLSFEVAPALRRAAAILRVRSFGDPTLQVSHNVLEVLAGVSLSTQDVDGEWSVEDLWFATV